MNRESAARDDDKCMQSAPVEDLLNLSCPLRCLHTTTRGLELTREVSDLHRQTTCSSDCRETFNTQTAGTVIQKDEDDDRVVVVVYEASRVYGGNLRLRRSRARSAATRMLPSARLQPRLLLLLFLEGLQHHSSRRRGRRRSR